MFKIFRPMFIIVETSLHPGSGGDVGVVDLPIQREKHTHFPKIEASTLKGSIRELFENNNNNIKSEDVFKLFGPEPERKEEEGYAGALGFMDARILLFPVKSLKDIFVWVTSPMVLERFQKEFKKIAKIDLPCKFKDVKLLQNTASSNNVLVNGTKLVLEEFTYDVQTSKDTTEIARWFAEKIFGSDSEYQYWKTKLEQSLVILPDEEFESFVRNSTEIIARNIINDKGTSGNLWYEEYIPQDTILYTIVMASQSRKENENKNANQIMKEFVENIRSVQVFQIGGNQTIGKGFVRINII